MTATALIEMKKQVKKSIDRADELTVKMIQAMLDVQENEINAHEDEIDRRFKEMEEGVNTNILTIDDFFERAKSRRAKKQKA